MSLIKRTCLVLSLALCALMAPAGARSEEARIPKTGEPAFAFDVPSGWTIVYDAFGNLRLTAADRSCAVLVAVVSDEAPNKTSMDQVAANIISSAGAPPYSSTADGVVAGIPGKAYLTTIRNPQGGDLGLRVVLARIDPVHFASAATLTTAQMTPAQTANLDALAQRLRLTGVK